MLSYGPIWIASSSRVRWIAPDLDAIPVGIPEIDRLPIPTGSPSPTRPFLDRHAVLGEMLLNPSKSASRYGLPKQLFVGKGSLVSRLNDSFHRRPAAFLATLGDELLGESPSG